MSRINHVSILNIVEIKIIETLEGYSHENTLENNIPNINA